MHRKCCEYTLHCNSMVHCLVPTHYETEILHRKYREEVRECDAMVHCCVRALPCRLDIKSFLLYTGNTNGGVRIAVPRVPQWPVSVFRFNTRLVIYPRKHVALTHTSGLASMSGRRHSHSRLCDRQLRDRDIPLRDVVGVKSVGCRKLKRETQVKPLHPFLE